MIRLDEAIGIYKHLRALPIEECWLPSALGAVLQKVPTTARDLPPHSQSALDGYVLHAEDAARAPCRLTVVDTVAAGDTRPLKPLAVGEAQRILTGARVPPGSTPATAVVVPQERVQLEGKQLMLSQPMPAGANIRWQGEEVRAGHPLARLGQRITPALLASLAAGGCINVTVSRRPRVAVLTTGDELKPIGSPLLEGQIWDCNSPMIVGWLEQHGYEVIHHHVPDGRDETASALEVAFSHHDVVITTGGVSVGDRDYVIPAAEAIGVQRLFWQVAQKPGKPMYCGRRGNAVLLGMPGNPAAVLVGLVIHLRHVLDRLEGVANPGPEFAWGYLAAATKPDGHREGLLRMRRFFNEDGRVGLMPLPHQDSHMLTNLDTATVLVRVPPGDEPLPEGTLLQWCRLEA